MSGFSRGELHDRWDRIVRAETFASSPPEKQKVRKDKEEWFANTFKFLIHLPDGIHIWCGHPELMGPLLETFHSYYNDEQQYSPLKLLWRRISQELSKCTHCVSQHHEAQQTYSVEFELDTVNPLLNVLQALDEERITDNLKLINKKISGRRDNSVDYNDDIVTLLFEVLVFPALLDDESLTDEFIPFIEAVDNSHELTLAGNQQYPGVYALLFLKSERIRSIGLRLAGGMGKMRKATDLEPLQPLLKKCISLLEFEISRSSLDTPRPRLQLERITVWLGVKSLLAFLEPSAFEEGILERYPVFLSIVLNHISDDTVEFAHAVTCLRLLFEMLGCKVWLKTTFSPSVMRNTLLGQCFHTRNEKSHKEIFDLFMPFLKSLEALQDDEHEKQRRHLIYFLLHQVTQSSNFSLLMRKKACKVALLIVDRGYKMNPPCPPFECSHMWGPPLLCSLKDSSLHTSLRQPAFDLLHTIIISDAAALTSWKSKLHLFTQTNASFELNDDEDENLFSHDAEEKEISCWTEFSLLSKVTFKESNDWMCIPLIWFNVLVEMDPCSLPISFSKAVIWALSRLIIIDAADNNDVGLKVKDWIFSHAGSISLSFDWEIPKGCDDGGNGKSSRNSVKVSNSWNILMQTFKSFKCATEFVLRVVQGELQKQWTWEPRMAESLILLLIDPNDNVRQVNRIILEHFSKSRSLIGGLQFLCSSAASMSATFLGLRHASKMVMVGSNMSNFRDLHHLFFVVQKLFKEVAGLTKPFADNQSSKVSHEGGFLWQPHFSASAPGNLGIMVDVESWNKLCSLLPAVLWPAVIKCISEAKPLIDDKKSQMACVRLMEIIPVIFGKLRSSELIHLASTKNVASGAFDFKWLYGLAELGKSSLIVVNKHWKQCLISLFNLFRSFSLSYSSHLMERIEELVCDKFEIDDLLVQVSRLSVSLYTDVVHSSKEKNIEAVNSSSQSLLESKTSGTNLSKHPFVDVHISNAMPQPSIIMKNVEAVKSSSQSLLESKTSGTNISKHPSVDMHVSNAMPQPSITTKDEVIVLSDDEADKIARSPELDGLPHTLSGKTKIDQKNICKVTLMEEDMSDTSMCKDRKAKSLSDKEGSHVSVVELPHSGVLDMDSKCASFNEFTSKGEFPYRFDRKGVEIMPSSENNPRANIVHQPAQKKTSVAQKDESIVQKSVSAENEGVSVLCSKEPQLPMRSKFSIVVPKRRLIQLDSPLECNIGSYRSKQEKAIRRFKPARLDDWYKPILEIDYFSTVGLTSDNEVESGTPLKLEEVPTYFRSSDHYVQIFRPLVLEEFKAQLKSSYMESFSSDEISSGSVRVMSAERIDDFHLIRCVPGSSDYSASRVFYENDLVLLTKDPFQNVFQSFHVVGKVERREKDNKSRSNVLVIRFFFPSGSTRLTRAKRLLIERSNWCITRIMSITSQTREFQALSSLNDIPLLPVILNPRISKASYIDPKNINLRSLLHPMQLKLKSLFNGSQLQAVGLAIEGNDLAETTGFSLIQGPPGTGKTRTIVAIVSAILALGPRQMDRQKPANVGEVRECHVNRLNNQSAAIARAWQDAALARQIAKDEEISAVGASQGFSRKRVLICAQSNAAVDELVSRISQDGLYGSDGLMYKPYLVRTGNPKTVHPHSMPYFIDTLVEQLLAEERINEGDLKNDSGSGSVILKSKLEKLVERIQYFEAKRAKFHDMNSESESKAGPRDMVFNDDVGEEMSETSIETMLQKLNAEKKTLYHDLSIAHSRERRSSEESRFLKLKLRKAIIREAQILVTTLSGCGGDIYTVCTESNASNPFRKPSEEFLFDAVVIDEAAQALEPATLIPLQLLKSDGTKCIMVGDPKQLPATVLSNVASKFLFECSMFERLQRAKWPIIMLSTQYRMHPEISQFPSRHFYEGKLLNGHDAAMKSAQFHESMFLGPYVFFDVTDGREHRGNSSSGLSISNEAEADAVVSVLRFLNKRYPSEFVPGRIGIISPYKSQVSLLRKKFANTFGSVALADVEFNTVDGFQGREVDILILSTVRSSEGNSKELDMSSSAIGFVADVRRMNVALTRARLSLWVFGNVNTLQTNSHWASMLNNTKERDLLISVRRPYDVTFRSKPSPMNHRTRAEKDLGKDDILKIAGSKPTGAMSVTEKREKERRDQKSVARDISSIKSARPPKCGRLSLDSQCDASVHVGKHSGSSAAERTLDHKVIKGGNRSYVKKDKVLNLVKDGHQNGSSSETASCADPPGDLSGTNECSMLSIGGAAGCSESASQRKSSSSSSVDGSQRNTLVPSHGGRQSNAPKLERNVDHTDARQKNEPNHILKEEMHDEGQSCRQRTKKWHQNRKRDDFQVGVPTECSIGTQQSSMTLRNTQSCDKIKAVIASSVGNGSFAINDTQEETRINLKKVIGPADASHQSNSAAYSNQSRFSKVSNSDQRSAGSHLARGRHSQRNEKDKDQICTENSASNLIAARKRQRDAVEALLPSALISSKKPDISSVSAHAKTSPSLPQVCGGVSNPNTETAPSSSHSQAKLDEPPSSQILPERKKRRNINVQEEWEAYKELVREQKRK